MEKLHFHFPGRGLHKRWGSGLRYCDQGPFFFAFWHEINHFQFIIYLLYHISKSHMAQSPGKNQLSEKY